MVPVNDKKLQCILFAPPSIGNYQCMGGRTFGLDNSTHVIVFVNYDTNGTCENLKMRVFMDKDHASYATDWSENGQQPIVPRHNMVITRDDMKFVKIKTIRVDKESLSKGLPNDFVNASTAKSITK